MHLQNGLLATRYTGGAKNEEQVIIALDTVGGLAMKRQSKAL